MDRLFRWQVWGHAVFRCRAASHLRQDVVEAVAATRLDLLALASEVVGCQHEPLEGVLLGRLRAREEQTGQHVGVEVRRAEADDFVHGYRIADAEEADALDVVRPVRRKAPLLKALPDRVHAAVRVRAADQTVVGLGIMDKDALAELEGLIHQVGRDVGFAGAGASGDHDVVVELTAINT